MSLTRRLLGGLSDPRERSVLGMLVIVTLLPLADLWLYVGPPWPDPQSVVVALTVPIPLLVYLVAFPLLRLQPPRRLTRFLLLTLGGAVLLLLAYLFLSLRFVHQVGKERSNYVVGGWAYTEQAQEYRQDNPGISDERLLKDFGSKVLDVFEGTSVAAVRALLLVSWLALWACGSLALITALTLRRLTPLDVRLADLVPQVRKDIRADLRAAQGTLRLAGNAKGVLLHGSSLGLKLLDELYTRAGQKLPNDNLCDCIEVATARGYGKTKGLKILQDAMASALHTIRTWSNKVDHSSKEYDPNFRPTTRDAETMLELFLRVLEWFYCESEHGPRLASIYRRPMEIAPALPP